MHWADHAARVLAKRGGPQTVASGITPSGSFHIGHLREILSAEMIHRSCLDMGIESRYIFIVDSMDPLRRVYSFLDDSYEHYIGHPLAFIPAPGADGKPDSSLGSYADHFLGPFLRSLEAIGVVPEVVLNHEVYASGALESRIHDVIERRDEIRDIIETISGRDLDEYWFPYNPLGSDGSIDGVRVTGYNRPYVLWKDSHGAEGKSDIRKADGKMPWRVDWAARWGLHGITCEPAGKDHGSSGGSYDTGIPISRLLGHEPPSKMVYEWIQIKGMGPMSSSSGNTIGPLETLEIVPPEIVRYMIARTKMSKHIDFNTGNMLFETADEYERLVKSPPVVRDDEPRRKQVAAATAHGALRLSQISRGAPIEAGQVPFRHLSLLAQIRSEDELVWESLRKSGHLSGSPSDALKLRLSRMRAWINGNHFPEESRIEISKVADHEMVDSLDSDQIAFIRHLGERLKECEWSDSGIGSLIADSMNLCNIGAREGYLAIYSILIGRSNGPKASTLMAECDRYELSELFSLA